VTELQKRRISSYLAGEYDTYMRFDRDDLAGAIEPFSFPDEDKGELVDNEYQRGRVSALEKILYEHLRRGESRP